MSDKKIPMTPEQEEAHRIAKEQPIPTHVINQAQEIGNAACENRLVLSSYVPHGSRRAYYLLSTHVNGEIFPLAVIPAGMTTTEWMGIIDKLISQHGTRELDPQFDGRTH